MNIPAVTQQDPLPKSQGAPCSSSIQICRILAPTNLSDDSRKSINYATELAQHFGAKLTLLHIHDESSLMDYSFSRSVVERLEQERWRAENALLALWIEIRSKHPNCDYYFASGSPREMIVRAAKGLSADLIVISTHDYHWLRHLFFGSDAEDILRHAPCPILIVHQHERDFVAA
jgi:nucleotide-binding universal stress UspA family protein